MTPDPQRLISRSNANGETLPSRIGLKPYGLTTGYVDGAWWPRSTALPDELAALLESLRCTVGKVSRVTFHRSSWDPAPRRVLSEGGRIALDGFVRATDPHTVTLIATEGKRTTLLLVPPRANETLACQVLATASTTGNRDSTESLLAVLLEAPDGDVTVDPQDGPGTDRARATARETPG